MATLCLLLAAAMLALPSALAYIPPGAPAYNSTASGVPDANDLRPYVRQWTISMQKRDSADAGWVVHNCNATGLGAACNQPAFEQGTGRQLRITFTRSNSSASFNTWKNGVPDTVLVRLDYGASVQVDRGWRKKNGGWPGFGKHVKFTIAELPWNATGGSAVWYLDNADEVPDAILYPEVCVICTFPDGSKDYCQCDRRNGATNYLSIETAHMANDISPGMRAAAIIMSIFCPIWLIVYSILDQLHYKKTGNALAFGRPHVQ